MKRTLVCCHALVALVVLIALAVLTATPALAGQDVLLSKKSKGFNDNVAFAVNPNNGDLLATWHRHAPRGFEIWVSRAKRRPNGKYKKGKARKLSLKDFEFAPRVAWIEENGEFFVVWERGARVGFDIVGRAVTAAGKPTGELVSLTADGKKNAHPVITASASGGIRVYHSGAPLSSRGETGRWKVTSLALSKEYAVEERTTLSKAKKKVDYLVVNDVLELSAQAAQASAANNSMARTGGRNKDCSIQRVTRLIPASPPKREVLKTEMCLYHGLEKQDCLPFDPEFDIRITDVPGSSSEFIVTELDDDDDTLYRSLFEARDQCSKLVFVRKSFDSHTALYCATVFIPLFDLFNIDRMTTGSSGQSAQDGAFGYFLSSETDGQVYEQAFDEDLNLLGNQDVVFDHGFTLTSMLGGNVPASSTTRNQPNSVLVWSKDTGNRTQQVRAHFFYLEPVD